MLRCYCLPLRRIYVSLRCFCVPLRSFLVWLRSFSVTLRSFSVTLRKSYFGGKNLPLIHPKPYHNKQITSLLEQKWSNLIEILSSPYPKIIIQQQGANTWHKQDYLRKLISIYGTIIHFEWRKDINKF